MKNTKDKSVYAGSDRKRVIRMILRIAAPVICAAMVLLMSIVPNTVKAAGAEQEPAENSEPKPFTVMLDTGHGGTDPGAVRTVDGVEYSERAFNDKLMNACYDRLTQYDAVIVYRTRVANNHISTYSRSTYAHNVGADLFLSFHINSSSYKSARGASTIIPSGNYRKDLKNETAYLSEAILSRLADVGLRNNGFNTRVLEDAAYLDYPDGSAGDYYEVIRMGVRYGIPSLILETAFITSDTDLAMLTNDAKIKEIGSAVADAIAARYGLKITGHTMQQPVQTAQTSGVSLGSIPKTLNFGDVVPLTASGGSGEGDYVYLASNAFIGRIEGNNLIVIGAGDFRVTVTRYEGLTTTPRSAGNTNVKAVALNTSVEALMSELEYSQPDGAYRAKINVRLKDQIEGIAPRGTVRISYKDPAAGAEGNGHDADFLFDENGNCEAELLLSSEGKYSCTVKYIPALYDGYNVPAGAEASLDLDVNADAAATPTPEPTEIPVTDAPTEVPTEEPAATESYDPVQTQTTRPGEKEMDNGNASVSFGILEILVILLIVAVIITIVMLIKLTTRKKRR